MRSTWNAPLAAVLLAGLCWTTSVPGTLHASPQGLPVATVRSSSSSTPTAPLAVGPNYTVTFHALGLAALTYWAMTFGGQLRSTTSAAIQFQVPNGTYGFSVTGGGNLYTPNPSSGALTVSGSDLDYNITWLWLYNLLFVQSGLPNNSPWFVFLQLLNKNAYSPATITYRVPNGTYNFTAGSSLPYNVFPKFGVLVVNGSNIQTNITFVPVPRYQVQFPETGLPAGFTYWVSLGGGNNKSATAGNAQLLNWSLSDGTYPWTAGTPSPYLAHPSSGTVVVSGADVTTTITFALPSTYPLTFIQHGLPTGTSWSVVVDGSNTAQGPNGADIVFNLANGSHSYVITTNSGLVPYPSSGFEGIAGKGATVWVNFSTGSRGAFSIVFTEQGLPSGNWTVSLAGVGQTGPVGVGLTFANLANGSYAFTVAANVGYSPDPASGAASVNGVDVVVTVQFGANTSVPPTSENSSLVSGLSKYEPAIVVTAILVVGALVWILARRGRAPPGGPATPNDAPVDPPAGTTAAPSVSPK